jgi:hypothetical protein
MVCPCCGNKNCGSCNLLLAVDGPYLIQTNSRINCRDDTFVDSEYPCSRCLSGSKDVCGINGVPGPSDSLPPQIVTCSSVPGVPPEYDDCTCAILPHFCTTSDFNEGVDGTGSGCFASISTNTFYESVFYFDLDSCSWIKIQTTQTAVVDSGCIKQACAGAIVGECSAECPSPRECTTDCDGPFLGCDCNEFP